MFDFTAFTAAESFSNPISPNAEAIAALDAGMGNLVSKLLAAKQRTDASLKAAKSVK